MSTRPSPSAPRRPRHSHYRGRPRRPARKPPGTVPGTLFYEGPEPTAPVRVAVIDYNAERFQEERDVEDVGVCDRYRESDTVSWVDVEGIHDVEVVGQLGEIFGLHPLTLEDIVSTGQRPKLEEYPDYVYVVLQMVHYDHETGAVEPEQVSLVVGDGFLLSFQEGREGDVLDPIRQRLRDGRGIVRTRGADYLAYALIDVIVDHYMEVLEGLGEHVETLEDDLLIQPDPALLAEVNGLRRKVLLLRRTVWPLRDVVLDLERTDRPFITDSIDPYLRDVYDHTVRTVELIESAREGLTSLVDLHLSAASHRMNEVVKVLTVISVFFLPLTFIAGVYGMNFDPQASPLNMPELGWFYGYPFAWGVMTATALAMYAFFRRRRWL